MAKAFEKAKPKAEEDAARVQHAIAVQAAARKKAEQDKHEEEKESAGVEEV